MEGNGGDLDGWPAWQAIAVPAAAFLVPALLTAAVVRADGVIEAVSWAIACAALQFALVVGVAFAVLDYGPA
jgi:hypothetical protein